MSSRPAHHCKPVNIVVQGTRRTKDAGMKTQLFLVAAWACALSPAVLGQIFLIQASPTPTDDENYPASLLELKEGGDVQTVSPLLQNLGPGGGTRWIGISYDRGKAVLASHSPSQTIQVFDLKTALIEKSCVAPERPSGMGMLPFEQWIEAPPGAAPLFVERYATADLSKLQSGHLQPEDDALRAMNLDPSVPCEYSFEIVPKSSVKFLLTDGQSAWPTSAPGTASTSPWIRMGRYGQRGSEENGHTSD